MNQTILYYQSKKKKKEKENKKTKTAPPTTDQIARPPGVWEVSSSIPVRVSDCFFDPRS